MNLRIYTHPCFLDHKTGPGHAERPERLVQIFDLLAEAPFDTIERVTPDEADISVIARAHGSSYINAVEAAMPDRGTVFLDEDTVVSPGSWQAALTAAGAVCQAVEDVTRGACAHAFCAVRPPGHHAGPQKTEGFCIFNNIFIGALHARAACGIDRVAIIDFDVHHGNGTDEMARRDGHVFFASTHEWPLYPGTGVPEDNIVGRIVNATLKAGDGSAAFREAYEKNIFPALHDFKPQLIMISAGFDAHRADPLADINLDENDFRWITEELVKIADRHAGGKIVSVLEGGYDLGALKSSVAAHLKALSL